MSRKSWNLFQPFFWLSTLSLEVAALGQKRAINRYLRTYIDHTVESSTRRDVEFRH
jgi:hypothetical protein